MADDEKNAEKNERVENEQVSDTTPVADTSSTDEQTPATAEVSDTSAQTPEAETTAAEEVSDTSAPTAAQETAAAGAEDDVSDTAADASGAATAEVSDTSATADAGATATEAVSDTSAKADAGATGGEEVSDTAPATVEKKPRSNRHVPRTQRRTRTKPAREKPAARKPITRTPKPESELGRRQERRGVVISDKGDKTIVVKVDVIKSHPRYKKVVRRAVKFHAHDEQNTAGIGDTVRIIETRPLSRTKRWRLAEIVEKAR